MHDHFNSLWYLCTHYKRGLQFHMHFFSFRIEMYMALCASQLYYWQIEWGNTFDGLNT